MLPVVHDETFSVTLVYFIYNYVAGRAGALYGIQSLVNMALQSTDGTTVAQMSAADAPRFQFRGMFLDVSRNFQSKESVLKLLQLMGIYKLNRLQLHLADDEGWRLEIPGLPELTAVSCWSFLLSALLRSVSGLLTY